MVNQRELARQLCDGHLFFFQLGCDVLWEEEGGGGCWQVALQAQEIHTALSC